jgi:hypothetical protein
MNATIAAKPIVPAKTQPVTPINNKSKLIATADSNSKPAKLGSTKLTNNQISQTGTKNPPLKAGGNLNNPAFDPKLSKMPKGEVGSNGSLTSSEKVALPSGTFGSVDIPKGSKFNSDGSVEMGSNTRARVNNFPLDIPKGSKIDKDGNLKLQDGITVQKDGQIRDKDNKLIPSSEVLIKDGKIIDLRGLSNTKKQELLTDGFKPKDEKGNPIPSPKLNNQNGLDYEEPFSDSKLNEQYDKHQGGLSSERAKEAENWQKANPAEVFNDKYLNKNFAAKLVDTVKGIRTGKGRCYAAVTQTLEKLGKSKIPSSLRASAYMFNRIPPETMKQMGLKKVAVPSNAKAIPEGAICVWDPGVGGCHKVHGHISIADGKGSQHYGVNPREFWSLPSYMYVPSNVV